MSTGLEVARRFARELVAPLVSECFPDLPYAVARLGRGSEVLGLDDERSRDHDWGLRLTLLLPVAAGDRVAEVEDALDDGLPDTAYGLPVRFATSGDPDARHRVEVATARTLAESRLGFDALAGISTDDWLSVTGQAVLEVVAGPVFADPVGELTRLRDRLGWYPDDLWRVLIAVDWQRIAQELPLVGRTGERGDDLGSRVVAARLVDTAMHLGFLVQRRWAPYPKWRGTLFGALPTVAPLAEHLLGALGAHTWQERESHLATALQGLHEAQRAAGLPTVVGNPLAPFWDRPFLQTRPEVVGALLASVDDLDVRSRFPVGGIEQGVASVDVLVSPELRVRVARAAHALG